MCEKGYREKKKEIILEIVEDVKKLSNNIRSNAIDLGTYGKTSQDIQGYEAKISEAVEKIIECIKNDKEQTA